MAVDTTKKASRKKERRNISHALVFINASFNNTIVSVAETDGAVLAWSSTGMHGFKGSRKGTPYAAKVTGEGAMKEAVEMGVKSVDIRICGPGSGRESALRAVAAAGVRINSIKDVTPLPHNGCRPPKKRRI